MEEGGGERGRGGVDKGIGEGRAGENGMRGEGKMER